MPRFARLRAAAVRDVRPGLQRITLHDGSEAYALTDLCGPSDVDDELLVNASAVELGLGTGGAHVVHTNLSSPHLGAADAGRLMKARYLSEQLGVSAVEEGVDTAGAKAANTGDRGIRGDRDDIAELPSLAGVRVVLCVLHSHALALAAAVRDATGEAPGYVMTDGGALPFVLSDLAAACLERGVIATAVSAGQAFGAPIEAVTVASGVAALAQRDIERVVVAPGPGHLGTASPLGFSALDLAGHAAVLDALGPRPRWPCGRHPTTSGNGTAASAITPGRLRRCPRSTRSCQSRQVQRPAIRPARLLAMWPTTQHGSRPWGSGRSAWRRWLSLRRLLAAS